MRIAPACLLFFASSAMLVSQQQAQPAAPAKPASSQADKLQFEVASVREDVSGKYIEPGYSIDSDDSFKPAGGLFEAVVPLSTYIAFAYKLDQMSPMFEGLPKWASEKRFAIHARGAEGASKDQVRQMMQSLLKERFHLGIHFENRTMSVLALQPVTAGKMGPQMRFHANATPCEVVKPDRDFDHPETYLDAVPCNVYMLFGRPAATIGAARDSTMPQIASFLSNVGKFGKPVIDETGIHANVDFVIRFSRNSGASTDAEFSEEPLQDAVKSQLGLKLVSKSASVRIPVIDHVELPTDN
jgi:uncharacterized protein (TIGR03435 family)